ncbi:MAG: hypothetical protein KJ621_01945, partial [Proteobacteria bacterium]|nr:hypothetical protein [Pseudomonadota bacterium]
MAIVDPGAVYKTFDTSSTAKTTTKTNELDKNAFMKMFLAQIQNQDPMNPMDATQLATQMAQFTTVEQLSNLNTTVTKLLAQQTGATNAQMINLLGREAVVRGNAIYVANEKMTQGSFQLAETAFCRAQVYDAEGNLVKTITLGQQAANQTISLGWDGTDDQGNKVADGTYTFKIVAERA